MSATPPLVLAIEGGGSHTRILLADAGLQEVYRERGPSSSPFYLTDAPYDQRMHEHLRTAKRLADATGAGVSAAALAGPMDTARVRRLVHDVFGELPIHESNEGEIAFHASGVKAGIALVAGTGSSCRARNERGEWFECGGYGPQFGDEGSGYWIAREGVAAVVRAEDGRGPETALRDCFHIYFGVGNRWELFRDPVTNGHLSVPYVAAFAKAVLEAAKDGDPVATGIAQRAGEEYARMVIAVAERAHFHLKRIPLVVSGGILHNADTLLAALDAALDASGFAFKRHPVIPEPVFGLVTWLLEQIRQDDMS